jgi:hypothetical protein
MSERKLPDLTFQPIDPEIVEKVAGGGTCSAEDLTNIIDSLQSNYDTLVDFTSYVIERVANATK